MKRSTKIAVGTCFVLATTAIALWTAQPSHGSTILHKIDLPDSSQLQLVAEKHVELGKRGVGWYQVSGSRETQRGLVGFVDANADLADLAFITKWSADGSSLVIWQEQPERLLVLHARIEQTVLVVSDFGSDETKSRVSMHLEQEFPGAPRSTIGPRRSMGALWGP